jgi:hypothetical protein
LDDPEQLTRVAATGQAHQRRFYDWDGIANDYLALFSDLEQRRSRSVRAVKS